MVDIAAYGAHPDDLELAIGGTIITHTRKGFRVVGIDLTRGEKGSNGTPEIRAREAAEAAEIMGVSHRLNLGLPDLGVQDNEEQLEIVVESIRYLKPRLILAPYWFSHHPDHENGGNLLRRAFFVAGLKNYTTKSPPFNPGRIFYYAPPPHISPSIIVDISSAFSGKMEAIACYRSQFQRKEESFPTNLNAPDFWKRIESRCLYWGRQGGTDYGEPLYTPQPPLIPGLFWEREEDRS